MGLVCAGLVSRSWWAVKPEFSETTLWSGSIGESFRSEGADLTVSGELTKSRRLVSVRCVSSERLVERASERLAQRATERATKTLVERSSERLVERATERLAQRATERATQMATERLLEKATLD